MKKIVQLTLIVLMVVSVSGIAFAEETAKPAEPAKPAIAAGKVGGMLSDFTLKDRDGNDVTLSKSIGSDGAVLVFTNSACSA